MNSEYVQKEQSRIDNYRKYGNTKGVEGDEIEEYSFVPRPKFNYAKTLNDLSQNVAIDTKAKWDSNMFKTEKGAREAAINALAPSYYQEHKYDIDLMYG